MARTPELMMLPRFVYIISYLYLYMSVTIEYRRLVPKWARKDPILCVMMMRWDLIQKVFRFYFIISRVKLCLQKRVQYWIIQTRYVYSE